MAIITHTCARTLYKSCNRTMCNRCQETSIKSRNKMDVVSRAILDYVCDGFGYVTYFVMFPDQWFDPTLDNRFITRDLIFTVNYTIGWPFQKKESFVSGKAFRSILKEIRLIFENFEFQDFFNRKISTLHSVLSFFKIYFLNTV